MHDEALRARFEAMGLFSKWKKGARCAVFCALKSVPEELWARGVVCPAERAVMLGATSKRVRALLARMQRRVPAAVRIARGVSLDAVAGGLGGLQGWCQWLGEAGHKAGMVADGGHHGAEGREAGGVLEHCS